MDYISKNIDGLHVYYFANRPDVQLVNLGPKCIRVQEGNSWNYENNCPSFHDTSKGMEWLKSHIGKYRNFISAYDFRGLSIYGFTKSSESDDYTTCYESLSTLKHTSKTLLIQAYRYFDGSFEIQLSEDFIPLKAKYQPKNLKNASSLFKYLDRLFKKYDIDVFDTVLCKREFRQSVINCASNSKDLTKNMVRVKSSNVWSYGINIKKHGDRFGDIVVQFKGPKGGPGDIYMLYDVPVDLYRKWVTAPSKGHFYWKYLRNNYPYRKLTGDKRGKLKNAIN